MSRRLLAVPIAFVLAAGTALAADPQTGEVSSASPTVKWSGTAAGYGFSIVADAQGGIDPCSPPYCDEFALTVKDAGDLTISLTNSSGGGFTTVEIEKPDGSKVYNGGADGDPTTTFKLKKAAPGTYLVQTETNDSAEAGAYTGQATLATGATAPAAPGPASPPASQPQSPGNSPTPQPQPASPGTTIELRTRSARAAKRLKLAIASSGTVKNVTATLRKGSKTVGTGKLAQVAGKAKITVKAKRKLKKGVYVLILRGTDSAGAKIGSSTKLKLR